jgi:hypothetical protein
MLKLIAIFSSMLTMSLCYNYVKLNGLDNIKFSEQFTDKKKNKYNFYFT